MLLRFDAEFLVCESNDLWSTVLPILPDSLAPAVDHGVALRSRRSGNSVGDANCRKLLRDARRDPLAPVTRQLHMSALYLATREVLLKIEVEANEPEHDGDRFGIGINVLHGVGIDDVLMNKLRITQFKRVKRKLVVEILVGKILAGQCGIRRHHDTPEFPTPGSVAETNAMGGLRTRTPPIARKSHREATQTGKFNLKVQIRNAGLP